jgi:hypothetical protein
MVAYTVKNTVYRQSRPAGPPALNPTKYVVNGQVVTGAFPDTRANGENLEESFQNTEDERHIVRIIIPSLRLN